MKKHCDFARAHQHKHDALLRRTVTVVLVAKVIITAALFVN